MLGEPGDYRVYTMQDLSRIKEMEEQVKQAEKMAAVGRIAAGIAHEFRNPLAAMSGAAQVLSEELADTPATSALMHIIIRESDRLEATIYEFLQFSRPAQLEPDWFSLATMVQEAIDMACQDPGYQPDTRISNTIQTNLDYYGDANQLRQVMVNLLTNGFHAMTNSTSKHLEIEAQQEKMADGGWLLITIRDSGHGIPEKARQKIFDPFFTRRENGTGLGLAIVQQIVDSHGGRISVSDSNASGTTFTILLPLKEQSVVSPQHEG